VSFRVEVQRPAEKELAGFSHETKKRIAKALRGLADEPFPPGVKKLRGSDGFRIRVGDYRILYRVDAETKVVTISAIGHRGDVYR